MVWDWKGAFGWRKAGPTKERLVLGGGGLLIVLGIVGVLGGGPSSPGTAKPQGEGAASQPQEARRSIPQDAQRIAAADATSSRYNRTRQARGHTIDQMAHAASNLPKRPVLRERQGRAFAYSVPAGWHVNETSNGVEIVAPDGITGVVASILVGGFGQPTPQQYLMQMLEATGQVNARFLSIKPIPPRPGPMGLQWRGIQAEIESAQHGQAIHIQATAQILQGMGQYIAIVTGAQGPIGEWADLKTWLPHVRDAIRVTNGSIVTGNMANALPRGIDSDVIYGDYNRAWQARQLPMDQISEAQREATMGYSRQMDPETGKIWDMPLEDYDPTVQGYRNPRHPHDVLKPACKLMSSSCY